MIPPSPGRAVSPQAENFILSSLKYSEVPKVSTLWVTLTPPKQVSGCICLGLGITAGFSLALQAMRNQGIHLLRKLRKCHKTGKHIGANVLRHSQCSGSSPSLSLALCHPLSHLPSTQHKSSFTILQLPWRNVKPCTSPSPAWRFIKQQQ